MKKKLLSLLLSASLLTFAALPVQAEIVHGDSSWGVTFTTEAKMESSFKTVDLNDVIRNMQPGDTAVLTVALQNKNSSSTDWYMTNKIISSLEDSAQAAAGGAYTYTLTYKDAKGATKTLFSSDTVGGENTTGGEGLNEVNSALKDYFYLDTLSNGQSGSVELTVALDGETQGNDYQNTLADLQVNFAVQLNDTATPNQPSKNTSTWVKTGDDTNLIPYFIAAGAGGVLLLGLGAYSISMRKKDKKEDA
ncbi:MAG: hypothetical protein V8S32_13830 [Lachnospiraceae bacterium]